MNVRIVTMLDFVRKVISETEDLGSLTIRNLFTGFMKDCKLQSLSAEEKETFRTIVDIVLEENNQIKSSKKENAENHPCNDTPRMIKNTRKKILTDSSERLVENCNSDENGVLGKQKQEKIESTSNGKMGHFIGITKGISHKKLKLKSRSEKSDTENEKCDFPHIYAKNSLPKKRLQENESENVQDNSPVPSSKMSSHLTERLKESGSENEQGNSPFTSSKMSSQLTERLQESESENEQETSPSTSSKKSSQLIEKLIESESEQDNSPITSSKMLSQLTERLIESESENEQDSSPVTSSKKFPSKKRTHENESDSEDKEDKVPIIHSKKSQSKKRKKECDEKPLFLLLGKTAGSSSSENKLQLKHVSQSSSDESSENDIDQSEGVDSSRSKKKKQKESGKSNLKCVKKNTKISKESKRKTENDDPRIKRLKKYISTAGLRVKYGTVFEGCKTKKKKVEKLLQILKDEGLKGKPTLKSCKALKRKREKKQELKELDVSNIIDTNGERLRRGVKSLYLDKQPLKITEEMIQVKKTFSRLKEIIDSEESD